MKYDWHQHIVSVAFTRSQKNIEVREPKPGLRHNTKTEYVKHRFPVKNGIDDAEHLYRILSASNPIFEYMMENQNDRPNKHNHR